MTDDLEVGKKLEQQQKQRLKPHKTWRGIGTENLGIIWKKLVLVWNRQIRSRLNRH